MIGKRPSPFEQELERLERHRPGTWIEVARRLRDSMNRTRDASESGDEEALSFLTAAARKLNLNENNVRRYLAVLAFLEANHLPQADVANSFTGLELIARIDKIEPGSAGPLLLAFNEGTKKTRELDEDLNAAIRRNPSAATARRGRAARSRSAKSRGIEAALKQHVSREYGIGAVLGKVSGASYIRAQWVARVDRHFVGYFVVSTRDMRAVEDGMLAAGFGERFFSATYVILSDWSNDLESFVHALKANAGLTLGILAFDQNRILGSIRVPMKPVAIDASLHFQFDHPDNS